MKNLTVTVTKINENEDTQVFTKEIDNYDIEMAINGHCEEMKEFKGFTGEVYVKAFKHVGSKIMQDTFSDKEINFEGNTLDIIGYDFENCRVEIYFNIVTGEDEEKELSIEIETDFNY